MGRPTPEQTKEMTYRKIVKDIWEHDLNRQKDELKSIKLKDPFVNIETKYNSTNIHRDLFDDYLQVTSQENKLNRRKRIEEYLKWVGEEATPNGE